MISRLPIALVCLWTLGFVATGAADPVVADLSGILAQGQELQIVGSEFGAKEQGAPLRWDDFDSEQNGAHVLDIDAGGQWDVTPPSSDRTPVYSNAMGRYNGDMCVLQDYDDASNKRFSLMNGNYDTLYVHFWVFRHDHAGMAMRAQNVTLWPKFSRNGGNPDAFPQSRIDQYWFNGSGHMTFEYYCEDTGTGGWDIDGINEPWLGEWFRMQRYIEIEDAGVPNGYTWAAHDTDVFVDRTGMFRGPGCDPDRNYNGFMIGDYVASQDGATLRQYLSECYVDITQARIEIGDNADWDSCSHREIQVPRSWVGSQIEFEVNDGTFQEGQPAYVFVVNENGVPSRGFPVVFGATHTAGDAGPPGKPGTPSGSGSGSR